jgi:ribosomal protein S18 acetylase RimI-like enzyme
VLLDDAIRAAAASGYLCLDLWVRRGNDRAEALYVSRGFAATGDQEAHPLGGEPMLRHRRLLV